MLAHLFALAFRAGALGQSGRRSRCPVHKTKGGYDWRLRPWKYPGPIAFWLSWYQALRHLEKIHSSGWKYRSSFKSEPGNCRGTSCATDFTFSSRQQQASAKSHASTPILSLTMTNDFLFTAAMQNSFTLGARDVPQ